MIAKPDVGHLPAGQARDDQGQARAHGRLRGCRASAGTRAARTRSARCCSACTTTDGVLQHVGVTSVLHDGDAQELAKELEPLRENAMDDHPWREWAGAAAESSRMPGAQSRWSAGKDLSWEPLRIERVCEVKYDHMQGDRFRHAAIFLRWRPDKPPQDCRYDQLEVTKPYELESIFSSGIQRLLSRAQRFRARAAD